MITESKGALFKEEDLDYLTDRFTREYPYQNEYTMFLRLVKSRAISGSRKWVTREDIDLCFSEILDFIARLEDIEHE